MSMKGKHIVYIGGFGGIGQKCLEAFLQNGVHQLLICDKYENPDFVGTLRQRYSAARIEYTYIDITNRQSIEDAFMSATEVFGLGSIDIVVNGSGLMNDSFVELTINTNLTGAIHSSLVALRHMDKSKGGRGGIIVNISSVLGLEPCGMFAIYSAAKSGLIAFTRALANPVYYNRTGVSCITICPGFTDTSLLNSVEGKETLTEHASPMTERFAHVKRQSAEDCAKNIINLLDVAANGSVWVLDDGGTKQIHFEVIWRPTMML